MVMPLFSPEFADSGIFPGKWHKKLATLEEKTLRARRRCPCTEERLVRQNAGLLAGLF
jgi:hypothetical protein